MEKMSQGRLIAATTAESADLVYGSGFFAPDEFVYAEIGGKRYVFVSVLEIARARQEVRPGIEVVDFADVLKQAPQDCKRCLVAAISKVYGVTRWQVPERFPLIFAEKLRAAGVEVVMADGPFFPERAVKRPDEIEKLRAAEAATQEAQLQVRDFIAESTVNSQGFLEWHGKVLTCEFIRAEVEAEFKRKSYSAVGTIIACGPDSALPHCIGSGPVKAGAPVVSDIFPRSDVNGYWGDMTRTFVKGKASKRLFEMYKAVRYVNEAVEAQLKPGVPCGLMQDFCIKTLAEAGFKTGVDDEGYPCGYFHGLGHSVGLEIHEQPRFSARNFELLQPGNVITVEPGLYYHDIGGVRIEDLVLITETGIENFCTMPKDIEVP